MSQPNMPALRVLLVEDSLQDAELTGIELRQAGLHVECLRVDDEAGMRRALVEFRPQLILSDLNLPGFSATRALQLARAQATGIRFIVFSGTADLDHPGIPGIDGWLCKIDAPRLPGLIRSMVDIADGTPRGAYSSNE